MVSIVASDSLSRSNRPDTTTDCTNFIGFEWLIRDAVPMRLCPGIYDRRSPG